MTLQINACNLKSQTKGALQYDCWFYVIDDVAGSLVVASTNLRAGWLRRMGQHHWYHQCWWSQCGISNIKPHPKSSLNEPFRSVWFFCSVYPEVNIHPASRSCVHFWDVNRPVVENGSTCSSISWRLPHLVCCWTEYVYEALVLLMQLDGTWGWWGERWYEHTRVHTAEV